MSTLTDRMVSETTRRLRLALDVFSDRPGAILYRGVNRWKALAPGQIGQVLAIGPDGLPHWYWIDELPEE